eukprot:gene7631-7833_t
MSAYPGVMVRPHAKVCEAEAMVAGGVMDVFISNEVVDARKITRLVALAAQGALVSVVVDAAGPLQLLAQTAHAWGTSVNVLVEINAGQDRCGVDSPGAAAKLAEETAQLSQQFSGAVNFAGIQAYHGGLQHIRDPEARGAAVQKVVDIAAAAVAAVEDQAGLQCRWVTGGGSGTYKLEAGSGVFNEIQPGSFAFGDADYARNKQLGGQLGEWQQSLWVLTQVMSMSESRACAVVDAGLKAFSLDSGPPQLLEHPNMAAGLVAPPPGSTTSGSCDGVPSVSFDGVEFMNGGDEHGKLLWPQALHQHGPPQLPPIGTKLLLQPGHCDPTVNMYDSIICVRGGRVVAVWPVAARGPGL